jgi:ubiquitin C-terminal hydrolase
LYVIFIGESFVINIAFLSSSKCTKCDNSEWTKTETVIELPEILIVQIKRYINQRSGSESMVHMSKREDPIHLNAFEDLTRITKLSNAYYKLYATCVRVLVSLVLQTLFMSAFLF